MAAVDHHGGEAAVDATLADVKPVTVVKVQADGQACLNDRRLHELHQISMVGVLARAGGNLKDQRCVELLRRLGDALNDLHVVDVERADGITALIRFFEHFGAGDKWHIILSFKNNSASALPHTYLTLLYRVCPGFQHWDGIFC